MTCTRLAGTLSICCLLIGTQRRASAQAAANDSTALGARQFAVTCAGCHGADGRGTARGAAIATQPSVVARSDAELARIVRDGVPGNGMPGMAQLGDGRIAAVVRYLRTLQTAAGARPAGAGANGASSAAPQSATQSASAASPAALNPPPPATPAAGLAANLTDADRALLQSIDVQQSDLNQKTLADNWVSYNGDYSGRRYSALVEVTPGNAARLVMKWRFHTQNAGVMEATPVVVGGVMFVTRSNDAYALDARTGKLLWHHAHAVTDGLIDDASGHINRGVAVLGTHVYMETDNAHLLCLDAHTGEPLWDVAYATGNKNYGATSAPLIVKDKVLVGTSGGDDGVRGFVAAYDARTGKQVWRFWTIPAPEEKGSESWPGDTYLHGGGTTWMPGTYDAELNTIYWGTGNPAPDFDGSVRPGDDLYTSSLLALDPDTGRLKWYFQYSPHNLYDYDAVQTPVLVDTIFRGSPRRLIVTASRNGYLYILDRATGEYLVSRQFIPMLNWAKGIDAHGRPISNNVVPNEAGVTVCPSVDGGTNWYSPTYSPETNTFYFRSLEACSVVRAHTEAFVDGEEYYSTGSRRPDGDAPETDYLNAFDLNTLDFAWRNKMAGEGHAWAGVMSTAGGVVAFGNDAAALELDDAHTGRMLWTFNLGQPMHSSPMAYGVAGKQYFAVTAGDDVIAFALP